MPLLDFFKQPGLLNFGAGLLNASGPSPRPISMGQALGQGLMNLQQGKRQSLQDELIRAQLQQEQNKLSQQEATQATLAGLGGFMQAGQDTGKPVTSNEATQFLLNSPSAGLQSMALQRLLPKPKVAEPFTLSPGQKRFDSQGRVIASGGEDPKQKKEEFDQAARIRGEFTKQSKRFVDVRDAYGRIIESSKDPSAAGDLSLIFNYMKMLDPESVVRESEFATAANSAGVPEQIRAKYNKILSGERLSPATRADFVGRSNKLFQRQLGTQRKMEKRFGAIAKRFKLKPEDTIIDFNTIEKGALKQDSTSEINFEDLP